ncbi:hypothetical protein ACWGKU_40455 [Kitasatospora sp. NPDC054768]
MDRPDLELQTLTVDGNVQVSGQTNAQGLHCAQTAPILLQSGTSGQRHPMSVLVRKGQTISGTLANADGDVDTDTSTDKMTTTLHWFPIGKSLELADG